MDTNDFVGSFAQENVSFTTRVVRTSYVGDNYWKVMIFIENDRYVTSTGPEWVTVPGSSTYKALAVNVDTYTTYTKGVLQSWLYDLFCNGFTGDCILVTCGEQVTDDTETLSQFNKNLEEAYALMKAYAYHKTVLAGKVDGTEGSVGATLAKLCTADKGLLSSAPYFPYSTSTPEVSMSDTLYTEVKNSGYDAFFSAHQDTSRNAALYSLGLALSIINNSGTAVGNSMDMISSANITSSGLNGTNLSQEIRNTLEGLNIQTFKPIGDNSGNVAAIGASTINGDVVQATWILSYITYMTKVRIAQLITQPNVLKNSTTYSQCLNILGSYLALFGESGSNRLTDMSITAPGFGSVASEDDVIIIPNAWIATYVDQVREVQITGTLYIGV